MKCKICKQKTDWDSSMGVREFIVCPDCFGEMVWEKQERCNLSGSEARERVMNAIFTIGDQVKKVKKRKGAPE
jgi:hypothetical protein